MAGGFEHLVDYHFMICAAFGISSLEHASTCIKSFQFVFGEGLDGQGQELREEWVVGFVGFAQF